MTLPDFLLNPNPGIYHSNNYVVADFETTNIDKGSPYNKDNRLILAGWKLGKAHHNYRGSGVRVQWGNEYQLAELVRDIEQADFLVAQNVKFELGWLARCGLDISNVIVYDTMIGQYVINGNRKTPLNLDYLCRRYGVKTKNNLIKCLMEGGVCPSEMPASILEKYGAGDVENTHEVFLKQRKELDSLNLLPVQYTRCLLTPVLADIEKHGMFLDKERVEKLYARKYRELQEVNALLAEITGGINVNSGKQVAEFLYDTLGFAELRDRRGNPIRTDGGARKADSDTIGNLVPRDAKQKQFLELKAKQAELNAEVTKALEKFYECVQGDSILYAQFNQTVTQTHRLSSAGRVPYNVQFQNFPRKFKPLFKARNKGWKIGEGDGAQLEFRVAADRGNDKVAIDAIRNRFDVHTFTAETLTKAGQKTDRQGAKEHTFKPLFGGQSGTKAEQAYYKAFRERYPDITKTQQEWINTVLVDKKLVTGTGLIFYWPDTRIVNNGYIQNTASICNYPIQSLATADIIPIAVRYLWQRMRLNEMLSFLVNTIHDSAIGEIHPDEGELFEKLVHISFTDDVYKYLKMVYNIDFKAPLEAEVKISDNWADSERWRREWLNED